MNALTGPQAIGYAIDRLGGTDDRFRLIGGSGPVLGQVRAIFGSDHTAATLALISATAIVFDHELYATIPILRPYAIRDRSKRGSVNKVESWGVPRADGYFCDDNTLLKRLPWTLVVRGSDPRIDGRRVAGGWTACHAWRALANGTQASSYGVLNSFVPVLIWVPSSLSSPTDVEGSAAQTLLKNIAYSFRGLSAPAPTEPYIARCWQLLGRPPVRINHTIEHRFTFHHKLVTTRVASMRKVAGALRDVTRVPPRKILSSRYTTGLRGIDVGRGALLSEALEQYANSVEHAAGGHTASAYLPFPE